MLTLKTSILALILSVSGGLASAQIFTGNAEEGEKSFSQCVSCHGVISPAGRVFHRASPTGPNLWGVVGRQAGTYENYSRYSRAIREAGDAGIIWNEANFVAFLHDPSGFLRHATGDTRARSNMNHRLQGSAEDLFAYLAQFRN